MLIRLKIQNLILIESADIAFGNGLNIITGETGSGKSAILTAIRLISGERSDSQLIGKNGDLAVVEATLSGCLLPEEILQSESNDPLVVRREIHKNGKSRCFVSDNLVSLTLLRQIIGSSIELIDQSSSTILCSQDEQRRLLDTFGGILEEVKHLEISFSEQRQIESRIEEINQASETRERDLRWAEEDLSFIEEVGWKKEEDENLTQQHAKLTHSQEILRKANETYEILDNHPLKKAAILLEGAARIDQQLSPLLSQLKSAILEVDEVQNTLNSYISRLETNPMQLKTIEDRLASIEQIKRRFGKTFELVEEKRTELQKRIDKLHHLEEEKQHLQQELQQKVLKNENQAKILSQKRKETALLLSSKSLKELQSLNLPNAQFNISISQTPLKSHGSDAICFLFSANAGHSPSPIEECASGGELSRLLLSLKTTLSDKENTRCLVFDEIDSNVGGNTASILGEKLKKISEKKQVICVTHFVQVAKCASTHFVVTKQQEKLRTFTKIATLAESEKRREYQRMMGEI